MVCGGNLSIFIFIVISKRKMKFSFPLLNVKAQPLFSVLMLSELGLSCLQ